MIDMYKIAAYVMCERERDVPRKIRKLWKLIVEDRTNMGRKYCSYHWVYRFRLRVLLVSDRIEDKNSARLC